jgi:carboxyl-terminal processing protease
LINLNEKQRNILLDRINQVVETKFYDPTLNGINWRGLVEESRERVVQSGSAEQFEKEINDLLRKLKTSHVGLYHQSVPRGSSRQAIAATLSKADTKYGQRWVFQDVHSEGPAHSAGIEPGNVLLRVEDQEIVPPESPWFAIGRANSVTVVNRNGETVTFTLSVPRPKSIKPPVVIPKTVSHQGLPNGVGLLKVSMFPGIVGIDVANEMTAAVQNLDCDRLIIDLRGNTGGGIGCLRLMSLLCPDKRPVGYSLSRRAAERQVSPERLPSSIGYLPRNGN